MPTFFVMIENEKLSQIEDIPEYDCPTMVGCIFRTADVASLVAANHLLVHNNEHTSHAAVKQKPPKIDIKGTPKECGECKGKDFFRKRKSQERSP